MRFSSARNLTKWSVVVILPWLAACQSAAPGMHFDPRSATQSQSSGTSDSYRASSGSEEEIKAILKPITPQLVKAEREARQKRSSQDISKLLGKVESYKIDAGDVLSVVVWDHPELTNGAIGMPAPGAAPADVNAATQPPVGFVVDHNGMIQFPFAGSVKVAGLTEEEARNMLTSKISRYIRNPKVTVRVQAFRSKRVYVDGEVKNPGLQALNDVPMTLVEALNRAGGVLPTGDQSRIVINRGGTNYEINLQELVQKGVNPNSIMLANGDIVRVRSRDESKVFVSGEVVSPRALTMHNGRLTLNEALGESGGVNPVSGDGSQIYVVRNAGTNQVVYQLDGKSPGALAMAEGFELDPKDVVYVAATPLANWNRVISLILPGALSGAVGAVTPMTNRP
ncbi:polysaccharide biosynthesis/export family protein [Noviherbaspirillum massiliense]|uniref:polysaccharide biosynthesis/export family protein n=1 Tax=Noviherbaspirillum massiliense TaxID=1465823 RepID=UPI0011DE3BCB|nr:polysaccharide biosynthesis/export family protein [Noviherbaspirillum massiliense]